MTGGGWYLQCSGRYRTVRDGVGRMCDGDGYGTCNVRDGTERFGIGRDGARFVGSTGHGQTGERK